ncbi:MAG: hypothetical protein KQI35_02690 [Bacteroidetes bacterium]|nr:hypothetical protein [Bacteroidota bacterium]
MKSNFSGILSTVILIGLLISTAACNKEEDTPPVTESGFESGIFIVNEGPFNTGTGTVTWFERSGANRVPKLFQQSNNLLPLGNLAQSMTAIDGKGFIVVNNDNTVWAVSLKTFQSMGSIENVTLPRYIADAGDGSAWLTTWDNKVVIFDPSNLSLIGEVATGTGPEKLLKINQQMWILNQGGYGIDSTITIIDIASRQVEKTLEVYPKPTGIQMDQNGYVWVLCSGHGWNGWPDPSDTQGHLLCINPTDYTILADFIFPNTSDHPEKLEINVAGDKLYYVYPGGIFSQSVNAGQLELSAFAERDGVFYSLGYDPVDQIIYAGDAKNFMQDGWVYRYNNNGELKDSLQAGIGPAGFCFPE